MQKGRSTIFTRDKPRSEYDDVVLLIDVVGTEEATGRLLCPFDLGLTGGFSGLALRAESADLWHRHMGHINRKRMDVLQKQAGNGVEYSGDIQACDVCAVGNSEHQAHPKQSTYDVHRACQLVTVHIMGPISPQALGGHKIRSPTHKVEGNLSHQGENAKCRFSRRTKVRS